MGFSKQKIMIIEKEKQIFEFKASHDENVDLFSPAVLQTNYNETLDLYNHELVSLKDTSNYLSECILNATEKVAEYSFLLKVLEKKNTDRTSFNNMDEIINKIDFCISLIEVDRERVKEELFH